MSSRYPRFVADVLDDEMTFRPAALRAVRVFARSRPWAGTLDERKLKFRALNRALAEAYEIPEPRLVFGKIDGSDSGGSCCIPQLSTIILIGRLSVVTFLHEFAHARGMGERAACRWSVNLFRRYFPLSWRRAIWDGHMIRQANGDD